MRKIEQELISVSKGKQNGGEPVKRMKKKKLNTFVVEIVIKSFIVEMK